MKNLSSIAMLILLMTNVNFKGISQEVSSVIITGYTFHAGNIEIETVRPDYSVVKKEFSRKDDKNFYVELKKVLDEWIQKGFFIDQTNSNSDSNLNYRYTYILIKEEK